MSLWDSILSNLPEVASPKERRLSFKEKLKWTMVILVLYFVLGLIPLFGLGKNELSRFEYLQIILGTKFGSLISLGIGPIVTASIVLQLLTGSGLMKIDMTSHEGKKKFQGLQKFTAIFFIIFEAAIYVLMGGLAPTPGVPSYATLQLLLIFQLFLGGILIMFMDEVISKWGFGSGLSLFIVAGVAETVFIGLFSPYTNQPTVSMFGWPFSDAAPVGKVWEVFYAFAQNDPKTVTLALAVIIATLGVFAICVFVQSMKIEIPLSFGRIRGHGIRWPLNFLYTSNIPVILIAALIANIQLWARLLQNWGHPWLGEFNGNTASSGLIYWIQYPNLPRTIIEKGVSALWTQPILLQALTFTVFMIIGAVIFSIFWVQSSGMDAESQAKQIMASGLQIPGFRKDQRVLERILERYIWPLTIMGAIAVGLLAALADLTGALGSGTGILLSVMIVYRLYQDIAKQHMMDMHPMMKRVME